MQCIKQQLHVPFMPTRSQLLPDSLSWLAEAACCGVQMKQLPPRQMIKLPAMCPAVAARAFYACTQLVPEQRPTALDVVQWLREDDSA